MKRCLSFLLVFLLAFSCMSLTTGAMAASKKVNLSITTKDPYTGNALGSVRLDIWRITKYSNGSTEECVKEVKTNSKGQKTVALEPGTYRINVSDAPAGYAEYTSTNVTVKADKSVTVNVLPLFTCKMKVLDSKGSPVSGAEVHIGNVSAKTNKSGLATVKNIQYGKNNVQVIITENGKRYIAFEKQIAMKAGAGQTINMSVNTMARGKWSEIVTHTIACKPIIYLYSKTEQDVNVRLGNPEYLTASYPDYDSDQGWNVTVHTDGLLTDKDTGRKLYSLYWEGLNRGITKQDTGFIVAGSDTISFLEDKLAYLGLTETEADEFIVYWLPRMQGNAYNYIRFATEEEINECMPLTMTPTADKVIRIWMEYTPLDEKPEDIPEQELTRVDREALDDLDFYAVEWGGTQL